MAPTLVETGRPLGGASNWDKQGTATPVNTESSVDEIPRAQIDIIDNGAVQYGKINTQYHSKCQKNSVKVELEGNEIRTNNSVDVTTRMYYLAPLSNIHSISDAPRSSGNPYVKIKRSLSIQTKRTSKNPFCESRSSPDEVVVTKSPIFRKAAEQRNRQSLTIKPGYLLIAYEHEHRDIDCRQLSSARELYERLQLEFNFPSNIDEWSLYSDGPISENMIENYLAWVASPADLRTPVAPIHCKLYIRKRCPDKFASTELPFIESIRPHVDDIIKRDPVKMGEVKLTKVASTQIRRPTAKTPSCGRFVEKGEWQLGRFIRRGSHGAVFLAVLGIPGEVEIVAVKRVQIVPLGSPNSRSEALKALRNERTVLSQLDYSHIVKYHGWTEMLEEGESQPYLYMFMEYVAGGSLQDFIGKLDIKQLESYTRQITLALQYLHERNICHRDIKSDNILVVLPKNPNSKSIGYIKVIDFGVSVTFDHPPANAFIGITGTAPFLAPESIGVRMSSSSSSDTDSGFQCESSNSYRTAMDIWSLGCTIIQMISGKVPEWAGVMSPNTMTIVYQLTNKHLPILPAALSTDPCFSDLAQVVNACLQIDPILRASADRLLTFRALRCAFVPVCPPRNFYLEPELDSSF